MAKTLKTTIIATTGLTLAYFAGEATEKRVINSDIDENTKAIVKVVGPIGIGYAIGLLTKLIIKNI